jgi:serine/threonine protein kinase
MRVDVVDVDVDDDGTAVLKPKSASSFSSSSSSAADDSDASSESEYGASGATLERIGGAPARRRNRRVGFAASFQSTMKKIGCGRSSVVYRGTHVQSGKICAVKVFRCDDRLVAMQASREVQILKKIAASRAKVASQRKRRRRRRRDVGCDDDADPGPDLDPSHGLIQCLGINCNVKQNVISIGFEMMTAGTLAEACQRAGAMVNSPKTAMSVFRSVTDALFYLHDVIGVAHRDVKPSNVLVHEDGTCKLSDFGLCQPLKRSPPLTRSADEIRAEEDALSEDSSQSSSPITSPSTRRALLGTMAYMAPELLSNDPNVPRSASAGDVWSLGLTIFECVVGHSVFDADDGGPIGLFVQICEENIDIAGALPGSDEASRALRECLYRSLCRDAAARATARELKRCPHLSLPSYDKSNVRDFLLSSRG